MTSDIHPNIHAIEQYVIDQITQLRREKRLTRKELGKIINTSASFVSNVECCSNPSKYNLKHVFMIAKFAGKSPRHFLPKD